MKTLKSSIILFAIVVAGLTSCKKDSTTPKAGVAASLTADNYGFDGGGGAAFKSTQAGIVVAAGTFTVSAIKDGTTQSMSIVLIGATTTGTYSLDQGNTAGNGALITKDYTKPTDNTLSYSTDNDDLHGVKGGGKVVITKFTSTEAEGTFYFTGYNSAGKAGFAEQGKFSGKINSH
ncbi:hypothetical protein [Mucilaginibacter sp.]|uniref:hypothetical protein n=1 Tax=Mucilaginibacter sp. TaxID=1882438 RepID=UPI0025E22C87|nr:hypothetical protein [Mucilaginibacter sp.]